MILYVFNADNDMALANFEPGYTPPKSIRQMMEATALLPTRWAKAGDGVLTEKGVWIVEQPAPKSERWEEYRCGNDIQSDWQLSPHLGRAGDEAAGRLISFDEAIPLVTEIRPWGWSPALCHRLVVLGFPESLLPTSGQLVEIRRLSSRERAVEMLRELVSLPTISSSLVGESVFCREEVEVETALLRWPRTILKAPWSGSGKGLRFGQGRREDTLAGWYHRILMQQGGVVVEPLYDKVADFAMEFYSDVDGRISYRGLSVFDTHPNGAYAGNRLWTEEQKETWLLEHWSRGSRDGLCQLQQVLEERLSSMIGAAYHGPLGVDMMVVDGGFVHPCVEINLRMTMGYVALKS